MSDEKKIYVGRGQTKTYDDGNHQHGVRINLSKIPEEHTWTSEKGNKFVRLNIRTLKEVDEDGNDNTVFVDTWKPDPNYKKPSATPEPDKDAPEWTKQDEPTAAPAPDQAGAGDSGSLPF